jgi:hypothetical protein
MKGGERAKEEAKTISTKEIFFRTSEKFPQISVGFRTPSRVKGKSIRVFAEEAHVSETRLQRG